MSPSVLLITPPLTQLNTPYPATAYLKGFLNTKNVQSHQVDLSISVILEVFSKQGLKNIFDHISEQSKIKSSQFAKIPLRMLALRESYESTIEPTIRFLQGKNATLADAISHDGILPEANPDHPTEELNWAFGTLGIQDKAKHIATRYLNDIATLITECIDPQFGFSRYAEKISRTAQSFTPLYEALQQPTSYIDEIVIQQLSKHIEKHQPTLIAITIPFPGNLYSALRCGQWIKSHYPLINVTFGGGYVNTELRSLSDSRIFEFTDYLTLDDGEAPLECLLKYLHETQELNTLKRTFHLHNGEVVYRNENKVDDYTLSQTGTPDYSDLPLESYISIVDTLNPMHRLWTDGYWNKLTMAHGCYWGKCTFCDTSLSYIQDFQADAVSAICDKMERIIQETGSTGFHFVDEAAPPALMRDLALEILRRDLCVSWWTNIRFEKSFSPDLCKLLKASGCIAVSGGLEVASDRLLALIKKGVTVSQVASVCQNFTEAGIMVHAYLMYGFPTQTTQESIDSLEMVRQLFEAGVIQSGFWHQFTMTAHSPIGQQPEKFDVKKVENIIYPFANNDIPHIDPHGASHEALSEGLKKSLLNYMHGIHFDLPLQDWFDIKIPQTSIEPNHIDNCLTEITGLFFLKPETKIIWINPLPITSQADQAHKQEDSMGALIFHNKAGSHEMILTKEECQWVTGILKQASTKKKQRLTFQTIKKSFENANLDDFESFWYNKLFNELRNLGLLALN